MNIKEKLLKGIKNSCESKEIKATIRIVDIILVRIKTIRAVLANNLIFKILSSIYTQFLLQPLFPLFRQIRLSKNTLKPAITINTATDIMKNIDFFIIPIRLEYQKNYYP